MCVFGHLLQDVSHERRSEQRGTGFCSDPPPPNHDHKLPPELGFCSVEGALSVLNVGIAGCALLDIEASDCTGEPAMHPSESQVQFRCSRRRSMLLEGGVACLAMSIRKHC